MCDTVVALRNSTEDGVVLFAKNSDREPNEAQALEIHPAADHEEGSLLKCTYITIPQVSHTYRVLLSRPFWIWGAEMGSNEHGVVIGNEAVFTKVPREKKPGLIGMDLLRLALERADTARGALDVIVNLLEKFGQGGNCGYSHPLYYDNSFIIADRNDAWVLETAGRNWAAEKVKSIRSISNILTIGNSWDLASPDLVKYAMQRGWCRREEDFDFARCYSDLIYTTGGGGAPRQVCTTNILRNKKGKLTLQDFFALLRTHNATTVKAVSSQANQSGASQTDWTPDKAILGAQVCMHAGWGPARGSQTAGSLVARLDSGPDEYWATATSSPCAGIFKPLWLDAGLPDLGPTPSGVFDEKSLWWRHEILQREVQADHPRRLAAYAIDRDTLETEILDKVKTIRAQGAKERLDFSATCFAKADDVYSGWLKAVRGVLPQRQLRWYYRMAWKQYNKQAEIHRLSEITPENSKSKTR